MLHTYLNPTKLDEIKEGILERLGGDVDKTAEVFAFVVDKLNWDPEKYDECREKHKQNMTEHRKQLKDRNNSTYVGASARYYNTHREEILTKRKEKRAAERAAAAASASTYS